LIANIANIDPFVLIDIVWIVAAAILVFNESNIQIISNYLQITLQPGNEKLI
jgi:hypothetical protein